MATQGEPPPSEEDSDIIEAESIEVVIPDELLEGVPEEKREEIQQGIQEFIYSRIEMTSGPIPNPRQLAQYEKAMPGSGDRIFAITEREQKHDHEMTEKMLNADIKSQATALHYTFIVVVLMISLGSLLLALGKDVAGFAILAAAAVSVGGIFLRRQSDKKKLAEAEKKQIENPDQP
ncbi:MAG: DUF2335 domain-containing protein [Chloroflexota bacterium]